MITEPPALPCRDDVLVDIGDEAPKPCLSPVEMRALATASDLLLAGTTSTAMRTFFPRPHFFGAWVKRPRKGPAAQTTCLPPPAEGGLFKQNQGELWSSILVVVHVVYAPARFWDGGARCFVGRFSFGRRMVPEAGAFLVDGGRGTSFFKRR